MRVLFVETCTAGHHLSYLCSLAEINDDIAIILPEEINSIDVKSKYVVVPDRSNKLWYFKWIKKVNDIARKTQPDIVHFVYGDDLYRFWGINLPKHTKNVITCHQIRRSRLRDMAYRRIARKVDAVVVHTKKLKADFENLGINNVYHIEYPQFSCSPYIPDAKEKLGIHTEAPVILALGATRRDKGLDFLLEALNRVNQPFSLLIAGAESFFAQAYIHEHITGYKERVKICLKFLSDEEFSLCLNAADIVCLPYRKCFDGASGPLGEGVSLGKMVVGAGHGSLGRLISENHLGYTFDSENVDSLAETLDKALTEKWKPDKKYREYQEMLNPERFRQEYQNLYDSLRR